MTGTPGNPAHPRRCSAPISGRWARIERRASTATDLRCLRVGSVLIEGRWFCYQHAPAWRTHAEILDRIRSLP